MRHDSGGGRSFWLLVPVMALLTPVLLAVVIVLMLWWLAFTVLIYMGLWCWWLPRGRDVLLVYSDSPTWKAYIDSEILPLIRGRAVVLNWSERRRWPTSLASLAFWHFGGSREYNPMAVVVRPFRRCRVFRFWQPFRDWKHGRPELLRRTQSELMRALGID